jgi:hypothetical protein
MGIYSNGTIYGLQIYKFNDDDISYVLFEETYAEPMSRQQMQEAYLLYTTMKEKKLHFKVYTECTSTLNYNGRETFMQWTPYPLQSFLQTFGV